MNKYELSFNYAERNVINHYAQLFKNEVNPDANRLVTITNI